MVSPGTRQNSSARVQRISPLAVVVVLLVLLAVTSARWQGQRCIENVVVKGTCAFSGNALSAISNEVVGRRIDEVVLADVRNAVLAVPFVKSAVVSMSGFSELMIEVVEKTPVAQIIGEDSRVRFVSDDGTLLPTPDRPVPCDVPLICGYSSGFSQEDYRQIAKMILTMQDLLPTEVYSSVNQISVNKSDMLVSIVADQARIVVPYSSQTSDYTQLFQNLANYFVYGSALTNASRRHVLDLRWNRQVVVSYIESEQNIYGHSA